MAIDHDGPVVAAGHQFGAIYRILRQAFVVMVWKRYSQFEPADGHKPDCTFLDSDFGYTTAGAVNILAQGLCHGRFLAFYLWYDSKIFS